MSSTKCAQSRAAIATLAEGPELLAESALLAGRLSASGWRLSALPLDGCASEDVFKAELRALAVSRLYLPWRREWHALLLHSAGLCAAEGVTPLLFGDDCERASLDLGAWPAGTLLEREPWTPSSNDRADASLPLWSPSHMGGPQFLQQPVRASLFAEIGAAPLAFREGDRKTLSPTAALARLEASRAKPRRLAGASLEDAISAYGPKLKRIEWWDREILPEDHATLAALHALYPALKSTVRVHQRRPDRDELEALAALGVDRVAVEIDAFEDVEPMSGAGSTVPSCAELARELGRLGMEYAPIVVLGLPGETRARAAERLSQLKAQDPARLLGIPFEPTGNHPAYADCEAKGLLPQIAEPWIREIYFPLVQPEHSSDEFFASYADFLCFMAEIQLKGQTA